MMEKSKNRIIDIFICFVITIMCLCSFISNGISVGHDLTFHLNRFAGLANAFEEKQILPKIYPYMNNGFGYASPLFYCDLFLYPFAIMYHFGLSAVWCYKLCVLFYTLLGNLFTFYIFKKETNSRLLATIATVLYSTAVYHLENILVRCALGEILAMTFIPLVLYAIYRILIKHNDCWIILGISFSLLVMAHLITTLLYGIFFFVMIVAFIFINRKDAFLIKKTLITILKGTLLAVLITTWYLLPMLEQLHSQTFWLDINSKQNQLYSVFNGFGDFFVLLSNEFVPSSGLILIVLGVSYAFVKKNKYINIILIYCVTCYLIIYGIIPANFLNVIQFYFRLNVIIFPLFVVVSAYVLLNIKNNKTLIALVAVISLSTAVISNIKINNNVEFYLKNDATLDEINNVLNFKYDLDYNHDELGGAEYLPYTEYLNYNNDSLAIKCRDDNGQVIDYIYEYDRNFSTIIFSCDNEKDMELILPLSWYKGYGTYELVDDNWVEIGCTYDTVFKEVLINANEGSHTYKVTYKGTKLQYISLGISAVSLVALVIYSIKRRNKCDVI